ncbi:MAG: fibronectin type III domain-containing protein, partial [Patescibacteria group bacterium]
DDFLIGASGNDEGGSSSGQVYLVLSPSPPTFSNTAASVAVGSGRVTVTTTLDDAQDFSLSLRVKYKSGTTCGTSVSTSTLLSTVTATTNDTGGAPAVSSTNSFQIGSTAGQQIITSSGANTISFTWDSPSNIPNTDGTYCIGLTADSGQSYSTIVSTTVTINNDWDHDWIANIDLSGVDASWWGETATDFLGNFLDIAGDVNGDGYGDIIFGASSNDQSGSSAGKAYLIFGKSSGWAMDVTATGSANIAASFLGEAASDFAGQSVAGIGDVNSDGLKDFAVGAIQNDENGSNAGQAYIMFGKTSGWALDRSLASVANASFLGSDAGDQAGDWMDGVGDVNGDGIDDVLLCSSTEDEGGVNNIGQCYMILGKTSGWAMDQNLGSPSVISKAWIGTSANDLLGISASGIGDINGDGKKDFAIGATQNDDAGTDRGQVYIFFGTTTAWNGTSSTAYAGSDATFVGEQDSSFAGFDIAGAGDMNGDGIDDMAVTANGYDNGATADVGKVYIIFGKTSGWAKGVSLAAADASYMGEAASDFLQRLIGGGDVNNDGYTDILVSAESNDEAGTSAGQTYVIFGRSGGWQNNSTITSSTASFWGEEPSDFAGRRLAMGDVTGDYVPDFLIGAYGNDANGSTAGQAYLIVSPSPAAATVPTNLSGSAGGEDRIAVSWSTPDNTRVTEFYVENTTKGTNSGWISGSSWTSTGLSCGTPYSFRVKARNRARQETAFTSNVSAQTSACTGAPPASAPSGGSGGISPAPSTPPAESGEAPRQGETTQPEERVFPFDITSPRENEQIRELPFHVSGVGTPGRRVSIGIGETAYETTVSEDGTFSFTMLEQLRPGSYELVVTESTPDGSAARTRTLHIIYAPAVSQMPSGEGEKPVPAPSEEIRPREEQKKPVQKSPVTPKAPLQVPVPPPTTEEREEIIEQVKERPAFLLILSKNSARFYEEQIEAIVAPSGDTIELLLR